MDTSTTPSVANGVAPVPTSHTTLADRAATLLRDSTYHALRHVRCQGEAGTVTLVGQVTSFHLKQMAQAMVGNLEGVKRVVNLLEVVEPLPTRPRGDLPSTP